jgi:hypothetical protein
MQQPSRRKPWKKHIPLSGFNFRPIVLCRSLQEARREQQPVFFFLKRGVACGRSLLQRGGASLERLDCDRV